MRTIDFNITGQHIEGSPISDIVGNTNKYVIARFTFSEEWENLFKLAIFTGADSKQHVRILSTSECEVPSVALSGDYFDVGILAGDSEGVRLTTDTYRIRVEESVRTKPPYDMISMYDDLKAQIEELKAADDNMAKDIEDLEKFCEGVSSTMDSLSSSVNDAVAAAMAVSDTANNAKEIAQGVKDTTDNLVSNLSSLNTKVSEIEGDISGIESSVNTIHNEAVTADGKATTAQNKANTAQSLADGAEAKAEEAKTTATNATQMAQAAQSTADSVSTLATDTKDRVDAIEEDIRDLSDLVNEHTSKTINSEQGAHGYRRYQGDWWIQDPNTKEWTKVSQGGGGGSDVIVDDTLSNISENPVQNKVITAKFTSVEDTVSNVKNMVDGISDHPLAAVTDASGVHGIRYYDDTLSVKYGDNWKSIELGNDVGFSVVGGYICQTIETQD